MIDPDKCRYLDEPLSIIQQSVLMYWQSQNQRPMISRLVYSDVLGNPMPETESWGNDVDPLDVWDEFTRGRLKGGMAPRVVVDYCDHEALAMGAPIEALFAGCMAAVEGALDDRIRIECVPQRGWYESGRIWQAVIADSGSKKSPAIKEGLSALRDAEQDRLPQDAKARAEYEVAAKRHQAALKKLEKENPGQAIHLPDPPRHQQTHRYVLSDTTVEALSEVLRHQDRGTLLFFDELSRWLAVLEGTGKAASDRANYLELYDGGPKVIDRIVRGLNIRVPNWSASIIGGIQPTTLRRAMKDVPIDGLLQRFYPYVCGPTDLPSHEPTSPAKFKFVELVRRIERMIPGTVLMTPEAQKIIKTTWKELRQFRDQYGLPEPLVAHLSKWEGGLYRWTLLYHVLATAALGHEAMAYLVSAETAQMVRTLHKRLFLPNLFVLYEEILDSVGLGTYVRWIAGYILTHGTNVLTVRDINKDYRGFKKLDQFERLRVLRALETAGWIEQMGDRSKAVVPSHWSVNPKVHFYFTERAETERAHRTAIKEELAKLRDKK